MALSVFECDTCKRTIERIHNKQGLDVVGRCIISDGCKGLLKLKDIKKAYTVPSYPTPVAGLRNWKRRKVLHTHNQTLPTAVWNIKHDLNTNPTVDVLIYNDDRSLVEIQPTTVEFIDSNNVRLTFNDSYVGMAQCISRSSATDQQVTTFGTPQQVSDVSRIQLTTNSYITVATTLAAPPTLRWGFTSPTTSIQTTFTTSLDFTDSATPWNNVEKILIAGVRYNVFGGYLDPIIFPTIDSGSIGYLINDSTGLPFPYGQLHLLLTDAPYENVDRNLDEYAVTHNFSETSSQASLIVNGNEIDIPTNQLKKTFPSIKIIR